MTKVACIIPARNEATRIGAVIPVVLASPYIGRLVVVDNASSDDTARAAKEAGAQVIDCFTVGKYEAMAAGVAEVPEAEILLFLDADLRGLTTDHIEALILPVMGGLAEMVCGTLARPWLLRQVLKYWAGLTGQRALNRRVWEAIPKATGFEVEPFLNSICRKRRWTILRRDLVGLTHTGKREKFAPEDAAKAYWSEAVITFKAYLKTFHQGWGSE